MTATVDDVVAVADSHRSELLAYCYRMTGSLHDAEDLVQEIQVRAWKGAKSYDPQRASIRTWLYRIATNVCLTALASAERRVLPVDLAQPNPVVGPGRLPPAREIPWLEPFPDAMLGDGDPAAVVAARESVRLAFVAALQHLPPLQRAVLILRDVLALRAAEVAGLLDTTTAAVNSALQRAHAQLPDLDAGPGELADAEQREWLARYVEAFEALDIDALKRILREDALLQMPPFVAWFHGRDAVTAFLAGVFARGEEFRMVPVRANDRPGLAAYVRRDGSEVFAAANLHLLTLDGDGIARMDLFHDPDLFRLFDLPAWL